MTELIMVLASLLTLVALIILAPPILTILAAWFERWEQRIRLGGKFRF